MLQHSADEQQDLGGDCLSAKFGYQRRVEETDQITQTQSNKHRVNVRTKITCSTLQYPKLFRHNSEDKTKDIRNSKEAKDEAKNNPLMTALTIDAVAQLGD